MKQLLRILLALFIVFAVVVRADDDEDDEPKDASGDFEMPSEEKIQELLRQAKNDGMSIPDDEEEAPGTSEDAFQKMLCLGTSETQHFPLPS
jgi:hypothetical protein